MSPFLPLLSLCPTRMRHVFSVGVSLHRNLEVSDAHGWCGVTCSTALATARPSKQMPCPAWHSRVIDCGYEIACVCPVHWCRRRGERRGEGSWVWVVGVCWKSIRFCLPILSAPCLSALLRVSTHCFQFLVIQFYFSFQKLPIKLSS